MPFEGGSSIERGKSEERIDTDIEHTSEFSSTEILDEFEKEERHGSK